MDVDKKKPARPEKTIRPERQSPGNDPSHSPVAAGNDTGKALRSAYQRMVEEQIPPEMLELLGKLD